MYSATTPWSKWLDEMTEPFKKLVEKEEQFILQLLNTTDK